MAEDTKTKGVSSDASVPTAAEDVTSATTELVVQASSTDVAAAADNGNGTVDTQAAAAAGRKNREAKDIASKKGSNATAGVVPTGGIVRQLEDQTETDRRTGDNADKSLAGEKLPVLRPNEPDPRQGVTTGDLTNPGIPTDEDTEEVTFLVGYHLYNAGEEAVFSKTEAQRLIDLGVAE
ncbi:hypothetical protein [Deinococcus altitudinis]|uniref:hypothetical protein n=1 Tax=Deinococcus altitudinis TaxID=468914 RepID=UPI003891429B